MNRVNGIINHSLFIDGLKRNRAAEADRRFCRHDMTHFLDVARIGRIIDLEEGFCLPKEMIYAAALLHDIGKYRQYEEGIPHERSSAQIAPRILLECGFEENETHVITDAILHHRDSAVISEKNLRGLLYRADKASRPCFSCEMSAQCNWKKDKKNQEIFY